MRLCSDSQSEKADTDSRSPSWNMAMVLLRFQALEEGELWNEIHKLSNAVKTQVSLHLNAWRQQLAYFIDTRYLRLEQYERQEMLNLERLRAKRSGTQAMHDTDRYMTREQKALSFREKSKEVGLNCFRYFSFRWRVGHLSIAIPLIRDSTNVNCICASLCKAKSCLHCRLFYCQNGPIF